MATDGHSSHCWPRAVQIVEVGPRDGLQNEPGLVPTDAKVAFIARLVAAGHTRIEVTSFVHPERVPQMADADALIRRLPPAPGVVYSALVPNQRGLTRAIDAGVRRIAVFTAASETFAQKNIGMSVGQSLDEFASVTRAAQSEGISVRGYVSTCFMCPYEGEVNRDRVRDVTEALLAMGVDEVSISDTVGAASPRDIYGTVGYLLEAIPADRIALHFHDTSGTALANVLAGLQLGVATFDASAGGLGGCPFAPGAAGNLATEDLVYMADRMGIQTGVIEAGVVEASRGISDLFGRNCPADGSKRFRKRRRDKSAGIPVAIDYHRNGA